MNLFPRQGFAIVVLLFGGAVTASLGSLLRGTVFHGDPSHEFRNQEPKITYHDRNDVEIPDWVRRRHPGFADSPPEPQPRDETRQKRQGQTQTNPFVD